MFLVTVKSFDDIFFSHTALTYRSPRYITIRLYRIQSEKKKQCRNNYCSSRADQFSRKRKDEKENRVSLVRKRHCSLRS